MHNPPTIKITVAMIFNINVLLEKSSAVLILVKRDIRRSITSKISGENEVKAVTAVSEAIANASR